MSGKNIFEKILEAHGLSNAHSPGEPLALPIDQTLTQDATGTMAHLQFEALNVPRVRTQLSVSYVDHNTFQAGYENSDDHRFLQSMAAKFGIVFSAPGNGICHQVHLERFGIPGKTLLGSDSHTSTGGGIGMLAIGAGGLDVAMAMAGQPFRFKCPQVVLVRLEGALAPWVSAKDVILELLRRVSVRGGAGRVFEYGGPGVSTLTVPERATITNMGAETGATSSIFPSDDVTKAFLASQGRANAFAPLNADPDARYDEEIVIDLSSLTPMVARPHMPDLVCPVTEVEGLKIDQVAIGSCTNSSFKDLATVAAILKGKSVHPETSLVIAPGSRQVMSLLAESGGLSDIMAAGGRILECVCGPCIGIGQSPPTKGVSLRTFNRNFKGRSGTPDASIYLCSPEVAAVSALEGKLTDPRSHSCKPIQVQMPETYPNLDHLFIQPSQRPDHVAIQLGPNIQPLPQAKPLSETIEGKVLIRLGDNITTDDIMPAGAQIMSLRSNIPAISKYVFSGLDSNFSLRALTAGGGIIAGGKNYGQGSSREHAALAPMYLGVRGVIALSFARIHRANLINFGILPMTWSRQEDFDDVQQDDELIIHEVISAINSGLNVLRVSNSTRGTTYEVAIDLDSREREVAVAGGLLNLFRQGAN